MPTYKIKGDEYDIPEDKVNEFEKDNKDAVISYSVGNNNYDIPVSERDEFLKDNKDARLIEDDKASLLMRPKEQFVGAFETPITERDKKSLKDSANNIARYSNDVIDNKQAIPTLTKLSTKDDGNLLNDARRNQYKDNIPLFDIDNKINAVFPTIKESIFGGRVPVYKIDKDIPASDYDKFDLAEKLLFKSKDILEAPTRTDNSNAIANVFRGVGDNLLNDTQNALTFGVRDLLDNVEILNAVKKYDKGESLTKGEESLLDASATLSAVEEFRKDDMSIGYKGGKSAMEMLPVVVDFVVGKGLANKAVNAVTKGGKEALKKSLLTYFAEKAGKGAIGKVGSYAGKAAVKLGDAALMGTAITAFQPVRATSDVIDRYKGNAAYGIEDNKAVYAGQKDKEKLGTAIYKSAASRSIENFTELLGGEFVTSAASKLIGNISDKITPSSIKPFINGIKNTEAWKLSETARRATGIQGFAPELLEEVIGIPINQLLVGDNNISELGTWEWWRDTGLQVGLVTMGMSSAQLPASGAEYLQGRKVRNMVSRQFRDGIEIASSSLGGIDALSQFDDAIKDMTPNDVQKYLISNFNNKDATRLFGYYVSKLNYGALMGSQEDVDRYRNEIIPSVEELMQNKYAFNKEQEKSRTRAVSEVGEEIINMIDAYPDESIDKVTEQLCERLNVNQAQALMDYVQDKKNVDNIFDRIEEEKQAQIEESSQKIISQSNKDTGDIISARMDDGSKDGLPVNIIGGTLDDGKGYVIVSYEDVDEDGNIITRREQVDQKRIFRDSLSATPLDEVLYTNEEDISNSISEQAAEQFSYSPNIPEPEPGIQFKIGDKNVQIAQIYPDGIVCEEIREDGAQGNVFSISIRDYKESFQDVIDNQELSQNNDNTVIDSNKSEDISNNAITANDDNINMSKEELPISTDTTKEVPNTDNPISTTQQIITDNDNIEFVNKQDVESTSLPTDKDGNILYHKLPIDDTLDDILDGSLSDVEVDNFVIANKKKAKKHLKKIQDNPPIIGINKAKYISDKQRWEDKTSEAKQIVDYWDEVEKQIAEFRKQIGNDTFFDISSIGEPMNGDELAAMFLYGHKLIRDSYLEETGFKNKEASGMFGLFAKKENGGITIDRAGELLMLSDDEDKTNFFDSADANAGKNAIINVLSEVRTKGDLFRYIQNGRNRLSEREKNAEYEAYERWVYANYDMSVEDYENYEYKLKERIEIFFKYYDEYEINSIFADIYKQEDDDGRIREENEQAQRAEQGTNNGDIKGESIQGNESGSIEDNEVPEFGREIAQGGQRSTNGSNENSVDLVGSKHTNGEKRLEEEFETAADIAKELDIKDDAEKFRDDINHESGIRFRDVGDELDDIKSGDYPSKDGVIRFSVWENNKRTLSLDKDGDFCSIERVFTESGMFSFTSGEKIDSLADVAYIFKNLENSSIENVFAVMVKSGTPTVIHLGMGNFNSSILNLGAIIAAYDSIVPEQVFFVHNHPSGEVKASIQDIDVLRNLNDMLPNGVLQDGIIINIKSGKFGVFNSKGESERKITMDTTNDVPIKLYTFDKQVFAHNFNPEKLSRITNSEDVARFISSHRLGDRKKISFLILNNANGVIGNIHTEFISIDNPDMISKKIVTDCIHFGGTRIILYGDFELKNIKNVVQMVNKKSGGDIVLLDGVSVIGNNSNYISAHEYGIMENFGEYKQTQKTGIGYVNKRFNEELKEMTEDNADKIHFDLGMPSDALMSGGVESKPIKLYGSKLLAKIKKHGFIISELHDLPLSVASPIAVFNNIDRKGNKSVLTELKTRNGNFLITIDLGKGEDADFDIVSSVFGKNDSSVVNWIDKGYATYIDKKKAINYLHLSTPIAEASNNSELSSITKIIESFVNPTLEHGKIISEIENLSETLHTPIRIVKDLKEISDSDKQLEKRKRGSKGWFDSNTGEVVIVLPNTIDERDAQATVLHELVAHKGLSEMLGKDNFDKLCERVFDSLSKEKQNSLLKKYENNIIAGDEYMASVADVGVDVSIFEKIKAFVREAFRSIGIDLKMKDGDIKYMLWKSKNRLMDGDSVFDVAAKIAKDNDVKIRFRDEDNSAKDEYENYISSLYFKAKEANQDSMLALKILQDIIEKDSGKKIETYEDAYIAENHMSSKSEAESKKYEENYFKPLVSSIIDIVNKGAKYKDVTYYMIAKHGLERNGKFAERDAKRWFDDKLKELDKRLSEEKIDKDEYDKIVSSYEITKENKYKENLEKDYSGLSSLMNELGGEEDVNYTEFATDLVEDFENKYKEETITLWERTNAATKKMLKKNLESGMMSNTAYEKVKNMFEYYIPLRGWKEDTASDVYEYFNSEVSPINSTLKSANGRMSLADDPIATIGNMANSTILMGNRNLMKQNFLNMVINRPNEIAKVRDVWYENVGSNDGIIWKQSFPDIDINATPEEVERLVLAHEELMKQKESEGNATKNINKLDVGMRISNKQANEHAVVVKRNGKEYVIYINGNPRSAQAINGLTNPDGNKRFSYIDKFNRQLAANFTTRNPAFVLTNFSRDMIFAVSAVAVKENSFYLARFTANIGTSILAVRRGVFKKEERNSQVDTYFKEFIDNGGETGYTALHNVDEYKKMIDRDIKKAMNKTDYLKAIHVSAQFFSDCNRMAEDVSRFNTYRTSREMGRSIVESIRDAKEITVNFNKKGAGYKTDGFFGITAGLSKNLFLFYNAAIQGLNNFAKLSIKHKSKFYTLLGGFTSAGFLVPMLNAFAISLFGDDDDKDAYNNLPEWVRRNNLCLYAPWMDNKFITIPLPIELRAFYGIGELCYQASVGNMKHKNIGMEILNQITELLPFNPLGQNGDIQSSFTPDFVKPLVQIARNKDFFGKPIYKENDFNIEDPEWTKIYNGTSPLLVSASKWLNEIGGGDKYTKGVYLMDWNPAKIEHVFENYFGGMGKTINQSAKTIVAVSESIANGEKSDDLLVRNIPVVNRFISEIDDRNSYTHSNDSYFYYKKEYDEVEHSLNGYKKEMGGLDSFEFAKRMQELISSTKYKRYTKFKNYNRQLEYLRKLEKEIPINLGEDRRKIRKSINELRGNLVTELDKIE